MFDFYTANPISGAECATAYFTTTVVIIYWGIENPAKWLAQTAWASKLGMERQTHELPRLSVGFVFYSKSISNVKSEILSLF